MVDENEFRSEAWLLWGLTGNLPGSLSFEKGRLSYRAHGFGTLWKRQLEKLEKQAGQPGLAKRLNNAQSALVLDVPVKQIRISFPWYYFSGGLKIKTGDANFRFSFARPNDRSLPSQGPRVAAARQIGKTWRSVFTRIAGSAHQTSSDK